MISIAFVILWLYLGYKLFDPEDWGQRYKV